MPRKLEVVITGDTAGLERALNKSSAAATTFGGKMTKVGSSLESFGKTLTKSVTLPIVGIGAVMVKVALDSEKSTARMDAAFKNVGVSVKGASGAVDSMESSGRKLGFTNNQIRDSIGSLVTSTGSLSKAHRELGIAEDLARFKGVDLTTSTRALTMANAGSMRAIKQLGITIIPVTNAVDALKNSHIKLNTEQGRAALAAAKLIDKQATIASMLDIVSGKVKGQGKAYAGTAAGGMAVFRAQLDGLAEKMGTTLLPILNRLVGYLQRLLSWFQQLSPTTQKWIMITAGAAALLGPTISAIGALTKAFVLLSAAMDTNPIVLLISAIVILGGAMAAATFAPKQFEAVLEKLGVSAGTAKTVVESLQIAFQVFSSVVNAALFSFRTTFQTVFDSIGPAISLVTDLIHGKWAKAWQDLKDLALAPLKALWSAFTAIFPQFPQIVSSAWNAIKAATSSAWATIVSLVRGAIGAAGSAARAVGTAMVNGVVSIVRTIGGKVKGAFDTIWGVISHVASLAFNAATAIGSELVHGVISGIEGAIGGAIHAVTGFIGSLVGAAKSAAGIKSPSTVMAQQVGFPLMQGVGVGIMNATGSVATVITNSITAIMRAAITAAIGEIAKAKTDLNTAMATLGGNVISAAGSLGPAFGTAQTRKLGGKLTAEQAAQAKQQAAEQQAALDKATLDARTKLSTDIAAGADAGTLAADQAAIDQAVQANADYQTQKQIDADAKALTEQQARDKNNLEKQWTALQNELKAHPERAAKIKKEIDKLLAKYGITPASVTAATDWSTAQTLFVQSMGDLNTSIQDLTKATQDLAGARAAAASPGGGGMPHAAHGGVFNPVPGGLIRIVEDGHPEAVIPLDPARRSRAHELMGKVSSIVGFADGGIAHSHAGFDADKLSPPPGMDRHGPYRYSVSGSGGKMAPLRKAIRAWVGQYVGRGLSPSQAGPPFSSNGITNWWSDNWPSISAGLANGGIVGFADGGLNLPKLGKNPKLNPTTGLPDVPEYRAAAMYLNDYGIDRNVTEIGTALAGLLGPGAQAKAAIRHTYVDGEELKAGSWRAPDLDGKAVANLLTKYPVVFEPGTPGQQISAAQAISRLKGGFNEVEGLIAGSVGVSGPKSKLERMTSHAVHIAQGYAYLTHAQNAAAALGQASKSKKNVPSFATGGVMPWTGLAQLHKGETVIPAGGGQPIHIHTTIELDGRKVGKSVQTYLGEQARWGNPGIPR